MPKPTGDLQLVASPSIAWQALLVVQTDGVVRELVSGETGTSVTPVTGASGDDGSGVAISVDMLAELAAMNPAVLAGGTGELVMVWCGDIGGDATSADQYLAKVGTAAALGSGGGVNGTALQRTNWGTNTFGLRMRGGFSGVGPAAPSPTGGSHGTRALSVIAVQATITSGTYANKGFDNGVFAGTNTTALSANDGNGGSSTVIAAQPMGHAAGTPVVHWFGIAAVAPGETVLDALFADPWIDIEAASAGFTSPGSTGTVTVTGLAGTLTAQTFVTVPEPLSDISGTVRASATGIRATWFDSDDAGALGAAVVQFTGLTTDGSGNLEALDIGGTSLTVGQWGRLVIEGNAGAWTAHYRLQL